MSRRGAVIRYLLRRSSERESELRLDDFTIYLNPLSDLRYLYVKNWLGEHDFVVPTILSATPMKIYRLYTHPLSDTFAFNDNGPLQQSLVTYTVRVYECQKIKKAFWMQ